jgi:site-specific DNA-methyltransferase (adenine-specific)
LDFDTFILGDAEKMDQFLEECSINLSIVKPPYYKPEGDSSSHIKFIRTIIKKITKATKIGGVCCLIISEDMTKNGMDVTELQALFKVQDDPKIGSKWIFPEQIVWVKSPRKAVESFLPMEEATVVSFDLTPFSTIWIMVRTKNENDYKDLDISNRIIKLKISEAKKQEMFDSMWFIPQKSELGYKDHLPKELVLRLLMIFSKENDLVLDPFSGNGITAVACKILNRHFVCIEKSEKNILVSKKRIKNLI